MKKFWQVENVGQYDVIVCDVEFENGRCGGAARKILRTEFNSQRPAAQREHLKFVVQRMDADIARLAENGGVK